jgi:RimJ/RimL family protein N-acetyltransferase
LTIDVPVLETARLTLRGHRAEDLEDAFALWSDPRVTRHIGGKPLGREEVWARLLRYLGHWGLSGYGFWQVRERATDRFIGEVGLADFKRDIAVPFDGAPEAGWVLAPWSHGSGYATEAVTAALTWIAGAGHRRTVCLIEPSNAASLRVAAKCGYRELARTSYKTEDVVVLERNAAASGAEPPTPR